VTGGVEAHPRIAVLAAIAVQVADEPVWQPAKESRQAAVISRIENELAHTDVPGKISGFHDAGQVIECLDSGVVERVLLGGVEEAACRAGEGGDLEEVPCDEGQFLARAHQAALVSAGHAHIIDN
jgi:hypothetical protein